MHLLDEDVYIRGEFITCRHSNRNHVYVYLHVCIPLDLVLASLLGHLAFKKKRTSRSYFVNPSRQAWDFLLYPYVLATESGSRQVFVIFPIYMDLVDHHCFCLLM